MPVRVVIADDHPTVLSGLRSFLEEDEQIEVVGEASTGREALALADALAPDVLLTDVRLPDVSGVEIARQLSGADSEIRVFALSAYEDPELVRGMMESGARGYMTKEQAPYLIADSVHAIAQGEARWFVLPDPGVSHFDHLSERERDVLYHIAQGKSNQEVADALYLSENTIRTHASSIYEKLDLSSGREAIALAWQSGFMDDFS